MILFIVTLAFLSLCTSEDIVQQQQQQPRNNMRRSYVCPPKFIRQGHRCYYFSKHAVTWQDAHFKCREMRSNLAVIRKSNQDKLIRNFLNKNTQAPLERWLGANYDWKNTAWKWAASGKPLTYNGFDRTMKEDKDSLWWHCLILDPSLQYRWSSRSCADKKHFICQTKIKTVANKKDKMKLARQYHVDKYNKLNEILVPTIPVYDNSSTVPLKTNAPANYRLNDLALGGFLPRDKLKRLKKHKNKPKKHYKNINNAELSSNEEIMLEGKKSKKVKRKRKKHLIKTDKNNMLASMRWKTYRKSMNLTNPFYPRPIVMEYSFSKAS